MTYPLDVTISPWQPIGTGTPPPTGDLVVPQSPSGSVTNQAAEFNNDNSISSTQEFLTNVVAVESPQQGVAALTTQPQIQGVPDAEIVWNNFTGGNVGSVGSKFS